ncbi:MAG TPA: transposase, partial [Ktedonobacterales bacterium]
QGLRAKTDRQEALLFARFGAQPTLSVWQPLASEVSELDPVLREQIEALVAQVAVLQARLAHPPPEIPRRPGQRGRQAQSSTRNLLERLTLHDDQVLAFLDDLTIPFDNNQAERDLRSFKVQQKISGCFRSDPGAVAYARIRGYLATLRKQGHARLAAIETVFAGHPLYPEFVPAVPRPAAGGSP